MCGYILCKFVAKCIIYDYNSVLGRISTIRETACAEVAEKFEASCVFNCISTGDTSVSYL